MAFINGKPHLNIEIDQDMDLWTVKEFLSFDPEDMFSKTILDLNPNLEKAHKLEDREKENFYKKYINRVYNEKGSTIENGKNQLQKDWDNIENKFLTITQKLFNEHPWPEGAYVGFLSIFNCNPRFLSQKTFQCYYNHPEGLVYVVAHEMLHFMFFDYVDHYKELLKNFSESEIWKLSEIFNIVILSLPEFVDLTNNPNPKPYPKHKDLIPDFKKLWNVENNLDRFLKKAAKFLN